MPVCSTCIFHWQLKFVDFCIIEPLQVKYTEKYDPWYHDSIFTPNFSFVQCFFKGGGNLSNEFSLLKQNLEQPDLNTWSSPKNLFSHKTALGNLEF